MWLLEWIAGIFLKWGFTRIAAIFKKTPQKDEDKAHEAENTVAAKSDADIDRLLRSKWER